MAHSNFKFTLNGVTRRIPFLSTPSPDWSIISAVVAGRFSLPSATGLSLTYRDEDNDVITLSSTIELGEFWDGLSSQSKETRFDVVVPVHHSTVTAVSTGLEHLLEQVKDALKVDVEFAVNVALALKESGALRGPKNRRARFGHLPADHQGGDVAPAFGEPGHELGQDAPALASHNRPGASRINVGKPILRPTGFGPPPPPLANLRPGSPFNQDPIGPLDYSGPHSGPSFMPPLPPVSHFYGDHLPPLSQAYPGQVNGHMWGVPPSYPPGLGHQHFPSAIPLNAGPIRLPEGLEPLDRSRYERDYPPMF